MQPVKRNVISVLVKNHSGVLARIANLFCQRGYNIDSLTVSATTDAEISRITIVVHCDQDMLEQLMKQTSKLQETIDIFPLDENTSLFRELLLVKIRADETMRSIIHEVANIYGAHIVDLSVGSMVVELTGIPNKIDAFLTVLQQYDIIEMCRTGITALAR